MMAPRKSAPPAQGRIALVRLAPRKRAKSMVHPVRFALGRLAPVKSALLRSVPAPNVQLLRSAKARLMKVRLAAGKPIPVNFSYEWLVFEVSGRTGATWGGGGGE